MKDDPGLDNLFEEGKELSSLENKTNISESLTIAGNIFLGIGWVGLFISVILTIVADAIGPALLGIGALLSCWISSLLFKGLAEIIDLLVDIKNK
jgi:hypothetical protein